MRVLAAAATGLTALALLVPAAASADSAPITIAPGSLPWTDPSHHSALEVLASSIASHVANRSVTVRCEGQTDWDALARDGGFDPALEAGYVGFGLYTRGGQPVGEPQIDDFAELSPTTCWYLQQFAIASAKPTKCALTDTKTSIVMKPKRVRVRKRKQVKVHGRQVWRTVTVSVTRSVPTEVTTQVPGVPGPCYVNGSQVYDPSDDRFWSDYANYAWAILTLAHESIHLGGVVGGQLSSGVEVGDPLAEARANCSGMQWMPWVAEQLGDTPDDALAIAQFTYDDIYPAEAAGTPYYSADCKPGGPMDVRADKTGAWP
jgi:hypothetical protein